MFVIYGFKLKYGELYERHASQNCDAYFFECVDHSQKQNGFRISGRFIFALACFDSGVDALTCPFFSLQGREAESEARAAKRAEELAKDGVAPMDM